MYEMFVILKNKQDKKKNPTPFYKYLFAMQR